MVGRAPSEAELQRKLHGSWTTLGKRIDRVHIGSGIKSSKRATRKVIVQQAEVGPIQQVVYLPPKSGVQPLGDLRGFRECKVPLPKSCTSEHVTPSRADCSSRRFAEHLWVGNVVVGVSRIVLHRSTVPIWPNRQDLLP